MVSWAASVIPDPLVRIDNDPSCFFFIMDIPHGIFVMIEIRPNKVGAFEVYKSEETGSTLLTYDGRVMMTDIEIEQLSCEVLLENAYGDVLFTGLGLGLHIGMLIDSGKADRISVLEKHQEVIDLVGPYFPNVEIFHGDAFTWVPSRKFDCIWHDIWYDRDTAEDAEFMFERFSPYCNWQAAWNYGISKIS